MSLFTTERLYVKHLDIQDKTSFIELLADPDIINQVPQAEFSEQEISDRFKKGVNLNTNPLSNIKNYWGIYKIGSTELIGLTMLLTNDEGDRELGYRFRTHVWGKGYGKEIAKGTIHYCFKTLGLKKLTADADIKNIASIKILSLFFIPEKLIENSLSTDQRFVITSDQFYKSDQK